MQFIAMEIPNDPKDYGVCATSECIQTADIDFGAKPNWRKATSATTCLACNTERYSYEEYLEDEYYRQLEANQEAIVYISEEHDNTLFDKHYDEAA